MKKKVTPGLYAYTIITMTIDVFKGFILLLAFIVAGFILMIFGWEIEQ